MRYIIANDTPGTHREERKRETVLLMFKYAVVLCQRKGGGGRGKGKKLRHDNPNLMILLYFSCTRKALEEDLVGERGKQIYILFPLTGDHPKNKNEGVGLQVYNGFKLL